MLSFKRCNEIVRQVAGEALIGTGLELLALTNGNVLGICEDADAYEMRIGLRGRLSTSYPVGVRPGWASIVHSMELGAEVWEVEANAARTVAQAIELARIQIAADLRVHADKIAPKAAT